MEEVDKSSTSWPHLPNIGKIGIGLNHVDSSFQALFVGTSAILNAGINYWDVVVLGQDSIHSIKRELVLIDSEIFIILHIVNISPHSIKWNTIFLISCHHSFKLTHILVSVPALMETKAPKRRNGSTTRVNV